MRVLAALLAVVAAGCGKPPPPRHVDPASLKVEVLIDRQSAPSMVALWGDAAKSGGTPTARVKNGTRCQVLETRPIPGEREQMCRVKAATGEEGWVVNTLIEWREPKR